jgi:peptidoglycan/LPS O-acetylase OafA/YrhL
MGTVTQHLKRMTASPQPDRIAALDGVRGLAILLVLMMHCLYIAPLVGVDIGTHTYARLAMLGWSGVDVFFVLSGFLITGILVRGKGQRAGPYFRNFYMRRSLRIFPLYYVVICLLLYVLPNRPPATGSEQMSYLLYYQNIRYACFGELAFDPARLITWSLAIEEQFYLVWPALVWFTSERALRRVCIAMVAIAIALRFVLITSGFEGTHFLTPCRMDALAVGALLSLMPPPRTWFGATTTVLGIAGLITAAYATGSSTPESAGQQMWGVIAALLLGVGLLCLARTSRSLQPLFTLLPLRSLGKYSYCIYLTHFLVIEFMAGQVLKWQPATLLSLREDYSPILLVLAFTLVCGTATWLLAILSWHTFEKWFLTLKRHFEDVRTVRGG